MKGKWALDEREVSGMIGRGSCLPRPARLVCASGRPLPFPHHLFSSRGQEEGQRLYRRSGPPLLFLSSNSVCLTSANISIFTRFPFAIYSRVAPRIGWSNRKLALPSARHYPSLLLSGIKSRLIIFLLVDRREDQAASILLRLIYLNAR
jgi:hypothetical protein